MDFDFEKFKQLALKGVCVVCGSRAPSGEQMNVFIDHDNGIAFPAICNGCLADYAKKRKLKLNVKPGKHWWQFWK